MSDYNDYWGDTEICDFLEALWKLPQYQNERQEHADAILDRSPASILDVGSGCGVLYKELKDTNANVSDIYRAVDVSQTFINKFTALFPEVTVTLEDAETLSFDDNSYEAVVFYDVLRHQPEYETLLTEGLRVSSKYVFIIETFVSNQAHEDAIISYDWKGSDIYDNWYSRTKMQNFIEGLYPSCSVSNITPRMMLADIS